MQINICVPTRLLQIILHTILNPTEVSLKRYGNSEILRLLDRLERFAESDQIAVDIRRKHRDTPSLCYESAIAFKIASRLQIPVFETAILLVDILSFYTESLSQIYVNSPETTQILTGLSVAATPAGYLRFEFDDCAIATWLNALIHSERNLLFIDADGVIALADCSQQSPLQLPLSLPAIDPKLEFQLQHAHARCCSLLRRADREKWVVFQSTDPNPQDWRMIQPDAIPWLSPNLQSTLPHPAEQALLSQLFTVMDHLAPPWQLFRSTTPGSHSGLSGLTDYSLTHESLSPFHLRQQTLKLAIDLAKCFQSVHQMMPLGTLADSAPMYGVSMESRGDRRQAHGGLIWATQRLLFFILKNKLGITVPVQL